MATIPPDLLRGDTQSGKGILSTLLAKARLPFGEEAEQRMTMAKRVGQSDADYYDRFYG